MEEEKKSLLKFPEKLGYAGIGIADNVRTSFFGTFLLFFCTNVLGVRPGLISTLLSISIIWDAINDPLIASYADNHPNKKGERSRPYLFASIPLALVLVLMFTRFSDSVVACAVIIFVLNLLYSVFATMHRLPFYAMMILVSPYEKDRLSVNKYHFFGAGIGTAIGAVAMWPLIRLTAGVDGSGNLIHPERGFFLGALIVGGLLILLSLYHYFTTRERVFPQKQESTPFFEAVKTLFKDKQFCLNTVMHFLSNATVSALTGYALYYTSYVLGNSALLTPLYAAYMLSNMIFIPFSNKLINKLGYKRSVIFGALLLIAAEIPFVFLATSVATGFILVVVAGVSTSIFNIVLSLNRARIADGIEDNTGKRVDSMVSNVSSFAIKCGNSLLTLIFGWILEFSHYDGTLAVQPQSAVNGIIFIMGGLVIIFCLFILLCSRGMKAEEENSKK